MDPHPGCPVRRAFSAPGLANAPGLCYNQPVAGVAEWQTHLTQNQAGAPRAGSSPAFGTFTKSLETQAFQGFFYVLECTFTLSFTLCQPENTLSGPPPWENGMCTPHFGAIITVIPQTLILQWFFVAHAGAVLCSIAQKSPRFAAGGSFYAFAWSMNACIRVALSLRICSVTWP